MVECLTRDRGAAGWSLTGVIALWPLSKTHLSYLSKVFKIILKVTVAINGQWLKCDFS